MRMLGTSQINWIRIPDGCVTLPEGIPHHIPFKRTHKARSLGSVTRSLQPTIHLAIRFHMANRQIFPHSNCHKLGV